MNYSELRVKMNKVRKEICLKRRKKVGLEKELADLTNERKNASTVYSASYTKKSQQAKIDYKGKLLKPLEQKLAALEKELIDLDREKEDALQGVSVEKMKEQDSDRSNVLLTIKESSDALQKAIVATVGERFSEELNRQITSQTLSLNEDKLSEIVNYFDLCTNEIDSIAAKSTKIRGIVDKLQGAIMGVDVDEIDRGDSAVRYLVILLCTVVVVLCFKFFYPVYAGLLIVVGILNIRRNYKILKILLMQKSIQDNIQEIEDLFHSKILEEVEKETQRLESEFAQKGARLTVEIDAVKEQIRKTELSANNSFVFDDKDIREVYELTLQQKESRECAICEELSKIEAALVKDMNTLKSLQKTVDLYVQNVQDEYLNTEKIGASFEIDSKFFIDVQENKPVFFVHPLASSLFLYDDLPNVINFIRLLNIQLRTRLSPQAFNVDVVDFNTIGRDYLKFKVPCINADGKTDESKKRLFKIITLQDEWKGEVSSLQTEMSVRLEDIKVDFGNIVNYNKFMLSIDSLTLPYMFVFIQDMNPADLMRPDVVQLLQNGADVGMFFHIFIKKKTFMKTKEKSIELMDMIKKFFVLEDSGPHSRAKDWILSLFEEEKH